MTSNTAYGNAPYDRSVSTAPEEKKYRSDSDLGLAEQATREDGKIEKFNNLSWKKLTICLIVEAIALGSLSIPAAFATLGMIPGVLLCVGLGLVAIYTSYVVGQVKLRYPAIDHYADAVKLIWGKAGYELTLIRIVSKMEVCALAWSIISAIILFALALPPSFAEFAWLGYVDFVSIIIAILITIISTGVEASQAPGGLAAVPWTLWPAADVTFYQAFLSTTNIIFAYSFAVCQFSFMSEMHTPRDYVKSIWALGLIEIFIYTVTGALIYAFVGPTVSSPALLSSSFTVSRIAFGIALPVIFISGSINGTVVARFIINRAFATSPIRNTNTPKGWAAWIGVIAVVTLIGWVIAEAVPFFNALLGLISSLFISGFTFYFPALFWFQLIKEGKWYRGWKNISLSVINAIVLIIGLLVLGCGTYASVQDILAQYAKGSVRGSFTCSSAAYS
ncbi:hypothetical protein AMS68_003376 [Peltaster fructicola]|uniref:Amino acid transporter transmembrane domain-containing protein n=1 Tax=Peltaster fructicola TaxID=286661 RepID=A0A6H0XTB4_9PEZI|nr:hypothetical protein AMS68_003376 [Peltaster fructicola]